MRRSPDGVWRLPAVLLAPVLSVERSGGPCQPAPSAVVPGKPADGRHPWLHKRRTDAKRTEAHDVTPVCGAMSGEKQIT